jgi:8-oxo-dGTP diphosphatase
MANIRYPDAPRVAAGVVVIHQHKVLLVLRGKPPGENLWAIPGGSVNLGETLQAAAEREAWEETGLQVKAGEVIYSFDAIVRDEAGQVEYHYVILDLKAEALDPAQPLIPGDDARAAGWFSLDEVRQLAIPISEATQILLRQLSND